MDIARECSQIRQPLQAAFTANVAYTPARYHPLDGLESSKPDPTATHHNSFHQGQDIMLTLIAGLTIFLGIHSLSIVNEPLRDRLAARLGVIGWQTTYAVIAIIGFVLIIQGYAAARLDPTLLYAPPVWLRHVALLLLVAVFPLLLAAYLPGKIQRLSKHPMLLATKVWALAHLLSNGMLHDAILFGAFLVWAVADRISMKRRAQRPLPGPAPATINDVIAIVGGLALYVWFVMHGHAWLIGVAPVNVT